MSDIQLKAASGGGSISLKGPSTLGTDRDLVDTSGNINLLDSQNLKVGTDADLKIWHDGSNGYISNNTGAFVIQDSHAGANAIIIRKGAEVELLHNEVLACETSANGLAFPSGKGIDFSANSHAGGMTSELLDSYEEGTWTPVLAGTTNHTLFNVSGVGTYTRVGRHVHCQLAVHNVDLNDSAGGQVMIKGLPFTEYKGGSGAIRCLSCNFMTNNVFFPTSGDMNRYSWYINDSNYLVGNRSDDGGGWVAWNISNFMASSLYLDITFSYIVAT